MIVKQTAPATITIQQIKNSDTGNLDNSHYTHYCPCLFLLFFQTREIIKNQRQIKISNYLFDSLPLISNFEKFLSSASFLWTEKKTFGLGTTTKSKRKNKVSDC